MSNIENNELLLEEMLKPVIVEYLKNNGRILAKETSPFGGWSDSTAEHHRRIGDNWREFGDEITPCSLIFPHKVEVVEKDFRGFDGGDFTIEPVTDMRGVSGPITCSCGKFDNVTLRVSADLQSIILEVLKLNYVSNFTYDSREKTTDEN